MKNKLLIIAFFLTHFTFSQWIGTAAMSSERSSHLSVVLENGSLLAAGGYNQTGHIKTAETFDLSTETWTTINSQMNFEHSSGSITKLTNSTVLLAGGYDGSVNSSKSELFDPANNTWTNLPDMNYIRADHAAILLQNGKVLIIGGYNGTSNISNCELFDPISQTWSNVASLNTGRSNHTATLLDNGKVLVAGGYNPNNNFQLNSTEIYDPVLDTWTPGPNLIVGRNMHAATKLPDGKVFISGGESFTGGTPFAYESLNSCEIYNPTTNTFSNGTNLLSGLAFHQQILVGDYIFVVGGKTKTDYLNGVFTSLPGETQLYKISTNSWTSIPMIQDGRIYFTANLISPNTIIVAGGESNSVELFEFSTAGISEIKSNKLSVHPNPTEDFISLNSSSNKKNERIIITDVFGKTILTLDENDSNKIDVSALSKGVYFVNLETKNGLEQIKFVKN